MKKITSGLVLVLSVVMLLSFGVFADSNAVEFLLPVGEPEVTTASVDGLSDDADILVSQVYSDGFFKSGIDAEVMVYFDSDILDAKDKLKISIVDKNNVTVATQVGCYFNYEEYAMNSLVYKLQTVSGVTLSYENEYQVKFTYTGSYSLDFVTDYMDVYPMLNTAIVYIDALDIDNSVFLVKAANVDENETYYMTLNGGNPVKVNAANGGFVVDFDEYNGALSANDSVYCDFTMYTEDEYGYQTNYSRYGQEYYGDSYGTYSDEAYNGVGFPENIGASAKCFYAYADWKDDGSDYTASDSAVATLYNADGGVVGSGTLTPYYNDYDEGYYSLDGEITVTKALDANCKYYLVTDDGYSIRVNTVFITSEPVCGFVGIQEGNENSYSHLMPTEETVEGRIYDAYNMPDLSKISVKIVEWNSEVVVYDLVPGSVKHNVEGNISFSLSRKTEVSTEKEYLMYVYYNGKEITSVDMRWNGGSDIDGVYFNIMDCIQTETATYMVAQSDTKSFNPKSVTFQLKNTDGTVKSVSYHREMWSNDTFSYYVLKVNESLALSPYQWELIVSDASGELTYYDYINSQFSFEPFIYGNIVTIGGYVNIFGEGLSNSASYAIYFVDENTGEEVKLPVTKVSGEGTLKIASNATSKYCISEYAPIFLTADGQPVYLLEAWYFQTGAATNKTAFYPTYNGQNHKIAILNLPSGEYTHYKLADSEAGLASASYKAITNAVMYVIKGDSGEQTIYAQFKDASGNESAVRMATINVDATKPVLSDLTNVPEQFLAKEDYWGDLQITISFTVTAGEAGELNYYFADENGERVSSIYSYSVSQGVNNIYRTEPLWDEENLMAKKLVVYMFDAAGNKSDELTAPTSIVEKYSKYTVGKTTYFVNNETGAIDNVDSEDTVVTVPSTLGGQPVTYIGTNAFADEYTIDKIVLPESITTIAMGAFSNMSLEEINIPSKVTILSDSLFADTISLKKVMLPAGLKTIESGAFDGLYSCPAIYFDGTEQQWGNVTIVPSGNSVIYGDYATIYFAESSISNITTYKYAFDCEGKTVVEFKTPYAGTQTIIANGEELYYSPERDLYVGMVDTAKINGTTLNNVIILDKAPTTLIYGNVDGKDDYANIEAAIKNSDILKMKFYFSGQQTLATRELLAADLNGDGRCANGDLVSMKYYMSIGREFPVLAD